MLIWIVVTTLLLYPADLLLYLGLVSALSVIRFALMTASGSYIEHSAAFIYGFLLVALGCSFPPA